MPKLKKSSGLKEFIKRHRHGSKRELRKSRLEHIASHFEGFEKNGGGYTARCPSHDDSTPSLSIDDGRDGRILVHCHAGCKTEDVVAAAGLSMADLMPQGGEVVATYDYQDEDRNTLYQVVRYAPKDFRQRSPDGRGGWNYRTKDCRKVLYRLPELLQSDTAVPVFIVEGEKDADRLTELGLTATTNAGGAKAPWLEEYCIPLQGRSVVLLPDNDDPGRERAHRIAAALTSFASSVKLVELAGLPEKGDVSDWLDKGGSKEQLLTIVAGVPEYTTTQHDNTRARSPAPDAACKHGKAQREPLSCCPVAPLAKPVMAFPTDVFPPHLRKYLESVAKALPCPPDFPGTMMLSVLSACIGRKRCIEPKPGWREYPAIWTAVVARSGDRKTPALTAVMAPLQHRQRELCKEHRAELDAYSALSAEDKAKSTRPCLKQIFTNDTTIEALKEILVNNPDGILFPADELAGWCNAMSQYKGGRGDDRQHWLSIFAGVPTVVNRKGQEPLVIGEPFVSITGALQPDALSSLIDEREDGLAARFLFAYPNRLPNNDWTDETIQGSEEYSRVCNSLLKPRRVAKPLHFSPAAKERFVQFVNAHRKELPPDALKATWAKSEGYCARIALLLFLVRAACRNAAKPQIDETSVEGALRLIEYFKSHALRVFAVASDQADNSLIGRVVRWVKKRGGMVGARDLQMNRFVNNSDAAKELIEHMAGLGYGSVIPCPRGRIEFRLHESGQNGKAEEQD